MPNQFRNKASEQLADEFGNLGAQITALTDQQKAIRGELIARGDERVEGPRFTVTVDKQTSTRLDTTALKEFFGAAALVPFEKQTESTVVRVKPTAIFGQAA